MAPKVDVAVVGGGGAGLVAALSAASRGAKVTVFEKAPVVGGSMAMSGAGSRPVRVRGRASARRCASPATDAANPKGAHLNALSSARPVSKTDHVLTAIAVALAASGGDSSICMVLLSARPFRLAR